MTREKRRINKRSQLIGAIFLLLFFGIMYRFYVLQIAEAAWYQELAAEHWNREETLTAHRGTIYDRNGEILARESTAYTVIAILNKDVKNRVEDPKQTAQALAPLLDMPSSRLMELMTQDPARFQVELRPGGWKIERETMEQIRDLELPGIVFREEQTRYYPNNDFASHVLGFLNNDGKPVLGLESYLDEILQGTDGYIQFNKDARGQRLPQGIKGIEQPQHGQDVYLTIDERIQLYVEQALDQAQQEFSPQKMTVVVSKPQTGEILAMSSRPSFNPNQFTDIQNYVNHAVSSTFEPGSTFKIVTLAAAIEEGIYNGDETYQSGSYRLPGGVIRDHNQGRGWGTISYLEGVQRSSNVAFVKLGWEKMPREVFYHYIHRFGFGQLTGIDLPQEQKGFVKPEQGTPPIDVATMTFGQGVTVSAIQQVAAVNAIANGGKLFKPYVIDRIVDSNNGEIVSQNEPQIVFDQVVSEATAQEVADILETVVTDGTGLNYYIDGYQVAGKTGTAQKIGDNGKYVSGEYIHSFIGFAPKDDPQLVIYVSVDTPKVDHYLLGGSVVAEIFKSVMKNSLQYLSVLPQVEEKEVSVTEYEGQKVEDYRQISIMAARQKAELEGMDVYVLGDGTTVTEQIPAPGSMIYGHERLYLIAGSIEKTILPDFRGWSLREVRDWAYITKVDVKTLGHGFVYEQSRRAGATLSPGEQVVLELKARTIEADTTLEEHDNLTLDEEEDEEILVERIEEEANN